MALPEHRPKPPIPRMFLRVLGLLWLSVMLLLFLGNALAPHLGRYTDVALQYVWYWEWHTLSLEIAQPFFDLATPASTIKSYYSALYRRDATHMAQLTQGLLAEHMRQRLHMAATAAEPLSPALYRSYLTIHKNTGDDAEVHEKFHLFWQQSLRFRLQRGATTWHIVAIDGVD